MTGSSDTCIFILTDLGTGAGQDCAAFHTYRFRSGAYRRPADGHERGKTDLAGELGSGERGHGELLYFRHQRRTVMLKTIYLFEIKNCFYLR